MRGFCESPLHEPSMHVTSPANDLRGCRLPVSSISSMIWGVAVRHVALTAIALAQQRTAEVGVTKTVALPDVMRLSSRHRSERVHLAGSSHPCIMHCARSCCPSHASPNGVGATSPAGRRTRDPRTSLDVGTLNTRRLHRHS